METHQQSKPPAAGTGQGVAAFLPPAAAAIRPHSGETYEQYVVRAHAALLQQIPEPDERNAAVWMLWQQTNGDPERTRAAAKFSADRYRLVPMMPLFVEHQKVGRGADGSETVTNYNVDELAAICRENNFRIADSDAYTGLVDRHTVPGNIRDPEPPKTLGYIGPYRLGMVGREHPRFAIFADEHHRRDRADVLSDRPRRSVEVLRLKANGRRYIDPVAALAEAPRLPLPVVTYGAGTDGAIVERYQATCPADELELEQYEGAVYPGSSNTFVKLPTAAADRDKNQGNPDMIGGQSDPDGLVRQVIDALQSTEEWQALSQLVDQMKQGQADPAPAGIGGEAAMPEPAPAGPQALAGQSSAGMMGPEAGMMGGEPGATPPPDASMEGDPAAMGGGGLPPGPPPPAPGPPAAGPDAGPGALEQEPEQPDKNVPVAPLLAGVGSRAAMAGMGRAAAGKAAQAGANFARSPQGQQVIGQGIASTLDRLRQGKDRNGSDQPEDEGGPGPAPAGPQLPSREQVAGTAENILAGPLPANRQGNNRYMAHHRYGAAASPEIGEPDDMNTAAPEHPQAAQQPDQVDAGTEREQYAALLAERDEVITQLRSQLAEVQAHNENILTEQAEHYAALQHQVVQLTQDRTDGERRNRLIDLAGRFPVVNVEEECQALLYSAGNEVDDEEFEQRIDLIEKYAAAAAVATPMVPVGSDPYQPAGPAQTVEQARYAAEEADLARDIINQNLRTGGSRISYPEAVAQARKQLGRSES